MAYSDSKCFIYRRRSISPCIQLLPLNSDRIQQLQLLIFSQKISKNNNDAKLQQLTILSPVVFNNNNYLRYSLLQYPTSALLWHYSPLCCKPRQWNNVMHFIPQLNITKYSRVGDGLRVAADIST